LTPETLGTLLEVGRIRSPLTEDDMLFLKRFGKLRPEVQLTAHHLVFEDKRCGYDLREKSSFGCVANCMLGSR
jgi:hypothetical protein